MESISRETLIMKSYEDQSDAGDFKGSQVCRQTVSSIVESVSSLSNHAFDETGLFYQDSQSAPPLELIQPASDRPSKSLIQSVDHNIQQNDRNLTEIVIQGIPGVSVLASKIVTPNKPNCELLKAPNPIDVNDSLSLGSDINSRLHPPQIGTPKFKRGPGRPRKDSLGLGKAPRLPSAQKIKSLLGGVRGRKKADGSVNSVGGSNPVLSSSGDVSFQNESPPRGTEDTAESDSSSVASSLEKLQDEISMFPELWPGKVCGFCNLGERSMLGQGDLLRLEISEGFDPLLLSRSLTPKSQLERDNTVDKSQKPGSLFSRRQKGSGKMKRLVSQSSLESINEPVDEICGFVEEPEYVAIFDSISGLYYAHYNCALWCDGVEKRADGSFKNLEIEMLRSLHQRCQHCGNLGAGLMCRIESCSVLLHFPCAALSGAFQEPSSRTLVCSSHIESLQSLALEISGVCTVCDATGDVSSLIMCSSCGHHYHGTCMALNCDPGIRAGWQCPACKVCQACRQPGDESKLLACDTCDKTYHIFCLRPALSSIPKHSWKCKLCRMCTDCGARTPGSGPSSRWHANFSVCDSCYQQRNKGLACPLCGKAYRHVAQKLMLQCHLCKKYVHGSCDPAADLTTYQQRKELYPDYEYICIPCKAAGTGLNTLGGNPRVLSALKRSDRDETEDGINQIACATSQDSLFSLEDDSFPGTESSNDLIWLDKCLSTSLEDIKPQLPQLPPKDKNLTLERLQKRKLLPGRPKGVDKIATIPPHPNSARKTRFNEFAKKRGPKPKLRLFGTSRASINRNSTDVFNKGDEEPGVENRMVLCSARDEYVLQQDVCVMCGAFGNDLEGRLISCAQCGQCYHPYCVNVKVTKVVLLKGWRCLDCTVCEGCGQRNDESRLILCDECDVSFHIYCIDPPLEQVPQGTWKCKWCAVCQYCGSNEPGPNSCWHENYTKCGPCVSQNMCPVCNNEYSEDDLIIKCFNCERWLHSLCDMIKDEDDAETCAEDGYFCILCRPFDTLPPHLRPPPKLLPPKKESPPRSPDPALKNGSGSQFLIDGIYLSEYGVNQIKSLTLELPRKKRKKVPNIADMEAGILAAIESVVSGGDDKNQLKNSNSEGNSEKDKDAKKRQRNLQKLGIGGFLVRLRGPRYKDDESEAPSEQFTGGDGDKPKRKPARRKIKNKLMETFPTYLQEAFFGKGLMDPTKDSDLSSIGDVEADTITSLKVENIIKLSKEEITELELIKSRQRQVEEINSPVSTRSEKNSSRDASVKNATPSTGDALDLLPLPGDLLDQDLVNTIINDNGPEIKVEVTFPKDRPRASIDVSSQLQIDKFTTNSDEGVKQDDVLTDFLSSQFSLDAMESGLPSMDSKDVEDIFKNVLVEESQDNNMFSINSSSQPQQQQIARRPVLQSTPASVASAIMPSAITQPTPAQASPSIQRAAVVQPNLASPVSFPPPSPYHSEYSNSPQFSPAFSEPPSPWPTPAEDVDQPSSYNQRSILKWEADEGLGPNATISAVLYANINHPELKRDYTSWPERSKQIAKIWRGLSTDKRAPYLQKARENRAASRMQKAQQDQDKLLSVGVSQPKTPRVETQEERHWKQMQALRQQQQMSLQESPGKDVSMNQGLGGAPHPHLAFTSGTGKPGIIVPSRATSDNSGNPENVRQPLQVTTPHDQKLPPLHSPQIQSPPTNHHSSPLQPIRTSSVEMTPSITSPIYGPRGALPSSQVLRSPLYPRIPFTQSSKQQTPSLSENYGNLQPVTEDNSSNLPLRQQYNETDSLSNPESIYNRKPAAPMGHESGDSRPSSSPQGQETRQHLRDLLQRQQVKKQEQDQVSPTTPTTNIDVPQGSQRQMWPHEEWQKSQSTDASQISRQLSTGIPSTTHNAHANQQFRQPYLPPNPRLPAANTQATGQLPNRPGEFRMGVNKPQAPVVDIRARMMINQQRSLMSSNITNVIRQQHAMNSSNFNQPRNSLDPYGHLVQQRHGKGKGKGGHGKGKGSDRIESSSGGGHGKGKGKDRIIQTPPPPSPSSSSSSSSSMLAQQLGRPLQSSGKSAPDSLNTQTTSRHIQGNTINQSTASASLSSEAITSHLQPDHQELPDSVTAELEKLEQEQHSDHNADVEPGDLEDLGMDDDDLLGMGADFNILEYADPELDQAVGGEKTNILDNLDLEEEDKEEKEHKRKEDAERGSKKEDIEFSNAGKTVKQKMSPKTSEVDIHSNRDFSHGGDGVQPNLLRPQPPPPPYPGPPPPYPGRPQEQPLLLEDLLEQEKREQLRQGSGLIGAAPDEPLLSDFDFERLKADVLSSSNLPVSLSPPNIVGQNSLPLTSQPSSMLIRNQPDWQLESEVNVNVRRPDGHNIVEPNMGIHRVPLPSNSAAGNPPLMNTARPPNFPLQSLPPPPNPPEHPSTEQERQMQIQYEQWLYGQQQVLSVHLKYFEGEVHKLRKSKKSLNSKLRQLRKNGNELTENDAAELERIAKDLPGLQKQLDQARKQSRQHNLLIQDYRNKQQKRQQMLGMSPGGQPSGPQGGLPNQSSPLGPAASSPLHSTPQSPMLSPSPSVGGPSPSPLMQHSPMASPLTPSPGPASNPMNQTSPRGNMNHGVHMMDDNSFSPNSDGSNRSLSSQNSVQANRMHHNIAQLRMGSTGIPNHQIMISQSGGMSVGNNPINSNLMMARGMNPNMVQMQHRPMLDSQCNVQRLRSVGQQDHMRNINPMGPRFQRIGMNQDMMMRARPPPNFSNPSQMVMSPSGQHYNVARVPFPSQSPTGSNMNAGNLRSPSPMTPIGGLGSPPNQIMMNQNRVSPASSPMRRPSGSGSMGSASPMAERPQSVENPLTPRNTGSRPHTPSSAGAMNCQNMDVSQLQQHMNVMENQHFNSIENCGMGNLGSPSSHLMQSFISTEYTNNMSSEYSPNMGGGGGGGGNPQILPFPSFSFFDGPVKLGLKGGNPFSVVSENATSNSNAVVEQNSNATIDPVLSVVSQQSVSSNPGEGTSACVVSSNVENLEASNSSSVVVVAATQVSEPVAHVIKVSTQQQQNEHSVTDLNSIESTSKQTSEENIISNHVTPSLLPKPEISSHENSSSSSSNAHNQNSIDLLKKSDDNIIDVASTKSFSTTGPVTLEENECNQAVVKSLQIEESTNTSANPNHLINDQPHQYNSSENLGNATHNIKSSVTYTVQQTGTTPIVSAVLHQIPVSTNSLNKTASIKQETIKNNTNAILKNDLVFQSKYNAVSQPMTISQCMTTNTTLQTTLLTSSIISQPFPVSSSFTDSRKVSNLSSNSEILSTTVSHAFPSTTALNTVQSNVILTPTTAVSTFANAVYHVSKQLVTTNKVPESVKFGQPMGLPNPPLPSTTLSVPPSSFVPLLKEPTQSTEQISDNDKLNSRVNSEQLVATTNQLQSTEHLKYASTTTTAVVISNIYTPFTQSNSSLNSNFLSNQDHSSSNKTALDNSIAIKTSQDNIVIQTSLPTPSDSDSLLPHSNKIENNSEQKIQYTNSFIASGHNLITSAQMTVPATSIMHTILAKSHVRPGSLPISHPVASTFVTAQSQIPISSTGESQNALLKQLLQNTGCASTAQTSENVGFSLTSCLQTRPTTSASVPLHTSHLSEAATRIPQPNPIVRPQRPTGPVQQQAPILPQTVQVSIPSAPLVNPIRMPIKTEILEQEFHPPTPVTEEEPRCPTPVEESTVFEPMAENNKEVEVIINEPKEIFEKEQVDKPILVLENSIPKFTDSKKQDEEAKKAKRRQYQSKRKQVAGKEATVSKKRPRKAGKPEEDYDAFIDNVMTQLRQLPPVGIVEPDLHHSFNNYSVFGGGDYNKLNTRGYSTRLGDLTGPYGHCTLKLTSDFYSSKPFGNKSPLPPPKTSPSHRGFYNQEFAAPKTVSIEKSHLENRTPTPIRESDTPDTIISSSSPECTNRESPDMFPGLRLVETDEDKLQHLRDSPLIEIAYPIPIRPLLAAKLAKAALDADKENNSTADISSAKMRTLGPFKENGNITVTLTLSTSAVDDIRGVLRNLANILSIEPPTYQIEKAFTPTDRKFFTYKAKDVKEAIDLQSILNGTAKFCKHCDVLVLNNIIKKRVTDLPGVKSENAESLEEFYFCSLNCYVQFSISHGGVVSTQEEIPTVVKHISDSRPDTKFLRQVQGKDKNGPIKKLSQIPLFKESDLAKGTNANLKKAVDKVGKEEGAKEKRKWHIIRYKQWTSSGVLTNKYKKPTEKEMTEMLFRLGITAMPSKIPEDTRKCVFCHQIGDGVSDGPGRLLNFDVDKWNHLNCALWSEEVYETENGALVNVENALKQSLALSCIICKQSGASVKCFKVRCTSFYHVGCAVKDGCAFYKNKSVYCPAHIPKGEKENELTSLSVFRRVYIQRDENRQVAVVMHHVDQQHLLRVGSLIFLNVGQLLPHQLQAFHTRNYIYPVGYKIVRFYWSMMKANKRCQYICSIHEVDGKPEFRITVQEEGFKEHVIKGDTAQLAWLQVLESVSKVRNAQDLIKVFPKYITGEDLFGLTEPAIVKVLESLPGIETLTDYNFKYGRNPLLELPLAINPSGCARSEPKLRTHFKKPHTQRTGASRASLPTAVLSSSEAACPYSKQFVHSKSSQYKKMKQEWRNNVYLARSKIQGLGLYAARDIEKHTMVIEYIGEIIRNELAELREKRYESQNRGIYMFRMDDERVIDATLCGGLARYINHSCNPNCVAETVEVDRDLRIIIFANRRISRGEELAYDYKFEVEDDQHKIPCLCGTHNCQQWMN